MRKFLGWITGNKVILILFIATAVVATAQSLLLGPKTYEPGGIEYNKYNNYTIFKQSYYHLLDGKDLYAHYPSEHWDIFKYSPTFSLVFGVFAMMPDVIGLLLWNLLNALILVFAIYYLPQLTQRQKGFILLACLIESMTAIQNEQSNGLMAGLIILAFGLMERKKLFLAALCLVLTVYIKLFGLVAFSLFLFYPEKWKSIFYTAFWFVALFLIPLVAVDFGQLKFLYGSWSRMLSQDHSASQGISVMGWLQSWFSVSVDKIVLALIGAGLFMLPFIRGKMYKEYFFRLLALSSVLIWIVIFNHKAESPTFIIAMAGVAIWYFIKKRNALDTFLFISAIILTTLSPTDIFPSFLRKNLVEPYVLKAVPCILIWIKIIYEMMIETVTENRVIGENSFDMSK